jgi:hypothetical protein
MKKAASAANTIIGGRLATASAAARPASAKLSDPRGGVKNTQHSTDSASAARACGHSAWLEMLQADVPSP